jgi:hypothetical protein
VHKVESLTAMFADVTSADEIVGISDEQSSEKRWSDLLIHNNNVSSLFI